MPLRVSTTTGEIKGIFFVMEIKEFWKDVPGYEGLYQVSNKGRIKSFKTSIPRILKGGISSQGYPTITFSGKQFKIHQVVAMAFLGHVPCGLKRIVDHINNDKLDNRVENLQITTVRFNVSKDRGNTSSKYTGVSWKKRQKKWVAEIRINGSYKYLGSFNDEYQAHLRYQSELNNIRQNERMDGDIMYKLSNESPPKRNEKYCFECEYYR